LAGLHCRSAGWVGFHSHEGICRPLWWIVTVALALLTLPWCLTASQPQQRLALPLLVGLMNALLVIVTAYPRGGPNECVPA
jgi:hypothetical protein